MIPAKSARGVLIAAAAALLVLAFAAVCSARPYLATDRERYAPREPITVQFGGFPGYESDLVTVVPADVTDNFLLEKYFTGGATGGTLQFAGLQPGVYEARAIFNWRNAQHRIVQVRTRFVVSANVQPAAHYPGAGPQAAGDEDRLQQYEWAFKTFVLWVPGGSYVVDNYDRNTSTIYTSAGTMPKSSIIVNRDGTYTWNSAYDGRIIEGRWVFGGGGIQLLSAQQGRTWTLVRSERGKWEEIFLKDGFSWYSGKSVTVINQ